MSFQGLVYLTACHSVIPLSFLLQLLRYTYSLSILAYLGLAAVVFNRSICVSRRKT